jgi:hypothetical protein
MGIKACSGLRKAIIKACSGLRKAILDLKCVAITNHDRI